MHTNYSRPKLPISVASGAFGTLFYERLRKSGVTVQLSDNLDLLSTEYGDISLGIHLDYIMAGARIIKTPTFSAQRRSQAKFGTDHLVRNINIEACRIARQAVEKSGKKNIRIAGVIGPTNISLSRNNTLPRLLRYDYSEQIDALMEGGAEILLIESVYDMRNGEEAVYAALDYFCKHGVEVPVILSAVTDERGKLASGHMLYQSPIKDDICAWGLNCFSPYTAHMYSAIERLRDTAPLAISLMPNAGFPTVNGNYPIAPQEFAESLEPYISNRIVDIVGGCCGTTPKHIYEISKLL